MGLVVVCFFSIQAALRVDIELHASTSLTQNLKLIRKDGQFTYASTPVLNIIYLKTGVMADHSKHVLGIQTQQAYVGKSFVHSKAVQVSSSGDGTSHA